MHPKARWGRRLGVAALLLGGILVAAHWGLGRAAEVALNKQVAAYRSAGEPLNAADLARLDADDVADADNAAIALRTAAAHVDETSEVWQAFEELEQNLSTGERLRPPLTDEELGRLRAVVAANQAALADVARAAAKPGVNWKIDFATPLILVKLPDLNPQRRLARLLGAAAIVAHHEADDAGALRRVREMLFVGRALDRQPTLVSHLVSLGISGMAAERLGHFAPGLRMAAGGQAGDTRAATPAQVRELLAELLDDRPIHEGRRRALRGERASQLDAATALAYGTMPLELVAGNGRIPPEHQRRAQALNGYVQKPLLLNDGLIMIRYTTALIETADAADHPAFRAKLPPYPRELHRSRQLHPLAPILITAYDGAIAQDFRKLADRHMAAAALAARWYALEHDGKLPGRLEDLAPKYLPNVPVDPMAAGGQPLRYVAGERPVLYSVGENGRDDGGREPPPTASMRERRETSDQVLHLKRHLRPAAPKEPGEPEEAAELEEARKLLLPGTP
jgi:hypothetical protein